MTTNVTKYPAVLQTEKDKVPVFIEAPSDSIVEISNPNKLNYSEDQELALKAMIAWFEDIQKNGVNEKNQIFYVAGWAGTGKTTIANAFFHLLPTKTKIRFGSFTGKAALRMKQAGMVNAQTLHSMIYKLEVDAKTRKPIFYLDRFSDLKNANLLVLDECSMVDAELGKDVVSFKVPILVLGDKGQLPPISGAGYFTERKPNVTLSQVHRQALENPIIQLATDIRMGKVIKRYDEDNLVTFPRAEQLDTFALSADQVLVGTNKSRHSFNNYTRASKDNYYKSDFPQKGERIICLRNNHELGIFNGQIGIMQQDAKETDDDFLSLHFLDEDGVDEYVNIKTHKEGFLDDQLLKDLDWRTLKQAEQFTYAYAITVHKSQGSQWNNVCILDDNFLIWDKPQRTRWLYTAVTRAANKLVIGKMKGYL